MKILLIGAGLMGGAVVYDLMKFGGDHEIGVVDIDPDKLTELKRVTDQMIATYRLDINDKDNLTTLLRDYDLAISAVPFQMNLNLTRCAIETHTHFLDMGGNSDTVRGQLKFSNVAKKNDVTVIPNCGLAPGLSNILAMHGFQQFEKVKEIHARVGGIPRYPIPPFNYQLYFNVEGLINEYVEKAEIIENGERRFVDSLAGLEQISFDPEFPELEAFLTSGGLSLLPSILEGKVEQLTYKTVRYLGHCELFKSLVDAGFAENTPLEGLTFEGRILTNRDLFGELLKKRLAGKSQDVLLFRVDIDGIQSNRYRKLRYQMIEYHDSKKNMTAMMRTTAFPTSIIALMIASGEITERGVMLPEEVVDGREMIEQLSGRNITVREIWS